MGKAYTRKNFILNLNNPIMCDIFISVIITAYNRKEFLLDAIKSVINQTLDKKNYEIIVIKNFKNEIIDGFIENNNIKNIIMDGTIGEFLYTGIKNASGNIISFLDDDDLFLNKKLEYVYKLFKNNKNLVYYHNAAQFMDKNGKLLYRVNKSPDFNISCISIKKDVINNSIKKINSGTDLFVYYNSIDSNKKITIDNKILTYYRFHNSSSHSSGNFIDASSARMKLYERSINDLNYLYKNLKNLNAKNILLDEIISYKIELNILYSINNRNNKYKININEILIWFSRFKYHSVKKYYFFKFIRFFELLSPIKIKIYIEYIINKNINPD